MEALHCLVYCGSAVVHMSYKYRIEICTLYMYCAIDVFVFPASFNHSTQMFLAEEVSCFHPIRIFDIGERLTSINDVRF